MVSRSRNRSPEITWGLGLANATAATRRARRVSTLVHQLHREGHLCGDQCTYSWTCKLCDFPAQGWVSAQVHGTQLPQTPVADRPRERLLVHGAATLRTAELLAILIRAGRMGESALQ